jgi:hypothetical protein
VVTDITGASSTEMLARAVARKWPSRQSVGCALGSPRSPERKEILASF